jgi:DNA-binding MarR family transcriptional regulator
MAIRFPTADDVVRAWKEQPTIFILGIVLGAALGGFFGWNFGSSGYTEARAQIDLIKEQNDKLRNEITQLSTKIEEQTTKIEECQKRYQIQIARIKELEASNSRLRSKKFEENNIQLTEEVSRLRKENNQLRQKIDLIEETSEKLQLSDGVENVLLLYLFKNSIFSKRYAKAISKALKIDEEMVKYYADKLKKNGLVNVPMSSSDGTIVYSLTEKGRAYVIEKGLLNQ